jgi:hypothetical protein
MISLLATLLAAAEPYLDLREQARTVLQAECGTCHTRGLKTAKEKALKVFDLTRSDFAADMSEAQLETAKSRFDSNVSKADLELFARFAAAELARRKR